MSGHVAREKRSVEVRVDAALRERWQEAADAEGVTLSAWLRAAAAARLGEVPASADPEPPRVAVPPPAPSPEQERCGFPNPHAPNERCVMFKGHPLSWGHTFA